MAREQKKEPAGIPKGKLPASAQQMLDELVTGPMTPEAVQDTFMLLKKALIERALGAELGHHLGYGTGQARPEQSTNQRNGSSAKTVLTDTGPVRLDIPRDRDGSFAPILIPKHERRFTGFDDKIIAMYARGMSVREIRAFLAEQYGTDVSADFISSVTDEVMDEVFAWQNRALDPMYPVVFFDALRVKIRDEGVVRNKAVYMALGVLPDGTREILGLWIENTEGAKFWMRVFNELKTRGVQDILIAVTDGLKGMPDALEAVFPATTLQTCIVHLIRNSMSYANWQDRRKLGSALRPIYGAVNAQAGEQALHAFAQGPWGQKYPMIATAWDKAWERVIPFFAFPPDIRRIIYTTNAIESVNSQLRKIIKTRGQFPTDEAALKLLWLAIRNVTTRWGCATHYWTAAMQQFAILYEDRFTQTYRQLDSQSHEK